MTTTANPPGAVPPIEAEALAQLEFVEALARVAAFAVSARGAAAVRARRPSGSVTWIQSELALVDEFRQLLDSGSDFRPEPIADIEPILERLSVPGHVLEAGELHVTREAIETMGRVRTGLDHIQHEAPLVAGLAAEPPPRSLAARIARAVEPDGSIRDDASPELARARRRVRETRVKLIALLEQALRGAGGGAAPSAEVTMRGGRYVIPVRRDARGSVRGIVHGESSSGATLFVEPTGAVDLGNELSAAESEEARAVLALLRELTQLLVPHVASLRAGLDMCTAVDDAFARARYAVEVDGHRPIVEPGSGRLELRGARHPLLFAESRGPVPFDLELGDGDRTLLVSGPNAGGKTVLLKAVGLLVALTQSGIIPPTGPMSRIPVFRHLAADIGDHQSISASLSTFSAHVAALRRILDEGGPDSLILLDELGGGTDPREGAALAGAVLLTLTERACTTLATTHLGELKDLATETPGIVNGSLRFDLESLEPTYQFVRDRPGRSYGLHIARRLGLPEEVLTRAEDLMPEQVRRLEATLAEVERHAEALAEREARLAEEQARQDRDRTRLDEDRARCAERDRALRDRERTLEREGREQARQFLLQARRRVEEALGVAHAAATEATAREARRLVEEGVSDEARALKKLEEQAIAKGWRVRGREGDRQPQPSQPASVSAGDVAAVDAASDIDLRGFTSDEAEAALTLALDRAVAADLPWLRIIHGKGTGALRKTVAAVLKRDARVKSHSLAPPQQGGSGVTVAELRS